MQEKNNIHTPIMALSLLSFSAVGPFFFFAGGSMIVTDKDGKYLWCLRACGRSEGTFFDKVS